MRTLYYSPNSPYARKVRIVLHELNLPYEHEQPDLTNLSPNFVAMNPNLRIPLLIEEEKPLFESNVIVDYLLQIHGANASRSQTPPMAMQLTRPEHHWEDLQVLVAIETILNSGLNLFSLIRSGLEPAKVEYLQREQRRIQCDLDWLEQRISAEGFVPGTFSVADMNLVCALAWGDLRGVYEWRGRPNLEAVQARYAERPSITATHPPG